MRRLWCSWHFSSSKQSFPQHLLVFFPLSVFLEVNKKKCTWSCHVAKKPQSTLKTFSPMVNEWMTLHLSCALQTWSRDEWRNVTSSDGLAGFRLLRFVRFDVWSWNESAAVTLPARPVRLLLRRVRESYRHVACLNELINVYDVHMLCFSYSYAMDFCGGFFLFVFFKSLKGVITFCLFTVCPVCQEKYDANEVISNLSLAEHHVNLREGNKVSVSVGQGLAYVLHKYLPPLLCSVCHQLNVLDLCVQLHCRMISVCVPGQTAQSLLENILNTGKSGFGHGRISQMYTLILSDLV